MGYWLVDRRPGSGRWRNARIDLVDELMLHKMASRKIIIICILYLIIWPYCVQNIIKIDRWMLKIGFSRPNQCHLWAWLKRPIFGVHDSQGSAETLVTGGGITNYHFIAYSFCNISAKYYQNRQIIRKSKNYYKEYLMSPKCQNMRKKICDVLTLLKYAKMQQSAKYASIAYSRFSDMPIKWKFLIFFAVKCKHGAIISSMAVHVLNKGCFIPYHKKRTMLY